MASPVIDVHTHCLTEAWFDLLKQHGGPRSRIGRHSQSGSWSAWRSLGCLIFCG